MVSVDFEDTEFNQELYEYLMDQWDSNNIARQILDSDHINVFGNDIRCSLSTIILFSIPKEVYDDLGNCCEEKHVMREGNEIIQYFFEVEQLGTFLNERVGDISSKAYMLLQYYVLVARWSASRYVVFTKEEDESEV